MIVIGGLYQFLFDLRFGDDSVYLIVTKLSFVPVILLIGEITLLIAIFKGLKDKWVRIFAVSISVVLFLVIFFLCSLFLQRYTLDGIESYSILGSKKYTWDEVVQCNIKASSDDVLQVEFELENGKNYSVIGGFLDSAWYTSDEMDIMFPSEDGEPYTMYIIDELLVRDVPFVFQEDINEKLKYDYWREIADDIYEVIQNH